MTKVKPLPPIEMLRSLFDYNPETGEIIWKVSRGNRKTGDRAGSTKSDGYRAISINHDGKPKNYQESRIVWGHYTGEDPGLMEVDHVNRVRDDNRICNLRLVTKRENGQNQRLGVTGERYIRKPKYPGFVVCVYEKYLGYTETLEEAVRLRDEYIRTNRL